MSSFSIDDLGLSSLAAVQFPPNVQYVSAKGNKLVNLSGLPNTVLVLDVTNNKTLTSLLGPTSNTMVQLVANNCSLTSLQHISTSITTLIANNNFITSCQYLQSCPSLRHVELDNNPITSMQYLPSSVRLLSLENCSLSSLANCPANITKASLRNNTSIVSSHLTSLPTGGSLKCIDIYGTGVTSLSNVPLSVVDIIVDPLASVSTLSSNAINVKMSGRIYKESATNISGSTGTAIITSITSNASSSTTLMFNISDSLGINIYQNSWTRVSPPIPFSSSLTNTGSTRQPFLMIITSLKVVASLEIRIISSDVSPFASLLDTRTIVNSDVTLSKFIMTRLPAVDATIELQARLGTGVSGNVLSKFGTIYSAIIYF